MIEFKYNPKYIKETSLLKIPLNNDSDCIVLTRLEDKKQFTVYDIRKVAKGIKTIRGILMTEADLKKIVSFLNQYFVETYGKTEIEDLLGYDPFEE